MAKPKLQSVVFKSDKPDPEKKRPARRSEQLGFHSPPRAVLYNKNLSGNEKQVAQFLYDHLRPGTNIATGSYETIGEDLGLGKHAVMLCIRELFTHRVIKGIEKVLNSRGGYFHEYRMEMYGCGKLRDASKIKEFKPKVDPVADHSQKILKKVASGKLGSPVETDSGQCADCNGTRWITVPGTRSVKLCETCTGKG